MRSRHFRKTHEAEGPLAALADPTSFLSWIANLPGPKIVLVVKLAIVGTALFDMIRAFYALMSGTEGVDTITFLRHGILVTAVSFAAIVISSIICAYVYRHCKKIMR